MRDEDRTTTDKILDLLLDALQERRQARGEMAPIDAEPAARPEPITLEPEPVPEPEPEPLPMAAAAPDEIEDVEDVADVEETAVSSIPEKLPSIHLEQMLGRLALGVALLLIVINIPFNRFGTSLARAMPDTASLIIRDGLVLKGEGDKIYVLQDNKKRWISTIDAFEYYGYRWEQVQQVDEAFLNQFEEGQPIYLLLKCNNSPHVYALENGEKRWIKDIPTFVDNGFLWEDIKFVGCNYLRNVPDGIPIPPDAGTPPQP